MRDIDSLQVPAVRRLRLYAVVAAASVVVVLASAYTLGWRPLTSANPSRHQTTATTPPAQIAGLVAIQFISATIGWVETYHRPNRATAGLFATNSGGRSWKLIWEGPVSWFHFIDVNHGFISGPFYGLRGTSDGGKTWHSLAMPEGPSTSTFFAFASPTDGLALIADVPPPSDTNESARLYRTQDGGAHWRLVNQTTPAVGALPLAGFKFQLGYRADGTAWLLAGKRGATPTALISRDSGSTWVPKPFPVQDDSLVAPFVAITEAGGTIVAAAQWIKGPIRVNGASISWDNPSASVPSTAYLLGSGQDDWQTQVLPRAAFSDIAVGFQAGSLWTVRTDQVCKFTSATGSCFLASNLPILPFDQLLVINDQTLVALSESTDGGAAVSRDAGHTWSLTQLPKN